MSNQAGSDLLTVPEAARALRLSGKTVLGLIRSGKLKAYSYGPRSTRIDRADLDAFVASARSASASCGRGSRAAGRRRRRAKKGVAS